MVTYTVLGLTKFTLAVLFHTFILLLVHVALLCTQLPWNVVIIASTLDVYTLEYMEYMEIA